MDAGSPLCHDAVIVLPGIMGSELVDRSTGDVLWGLSPRAYARLWAGDGIKRLHLTDEERAGALGRVRAAGLIRFPTASPGLGGFEPYTGLVRRLMHITPHPDAVTAFPYDWRLPVRMNASLLADAAEDHLRRWRRHPQGSSDARLVLVAHSMGGLVASCFTEGFGGRDLVRLTLTLGTPFHGAVKSLLLLNTGRGAPIPMPRKRLRDMAATLPGVYDLLPSYRCLDEGGTTRRITPADVAALGGSAELAAESLRLHETFARPDAARLRTVVGVEQPTVQSFRLDAGIVVPQWHLPSASGDGGPVNHGGDGTVYVEAALGGVEPVATLPQSHGGIARTLEAQAVVTATLTRQRLGPPMGAGGPGVEVADVVAAERPFPIVIRARSAGTPRCRVVDLETGAQVGMPVAVPADGEFVATAGVPREGAYRVEVKDGGYSAVTSVVLALPANELEARG